MAPVLTNLPANPGDARDTAMIPGLGRSPGGGHSNPLQYPCLENSMGRKAWHVTVHGAMKIQAQLCDSVHTHTFLTYV